MIRKRFKWFCKHLIYIYALLGAILINLVGFFRTKAEIEINNYNQDQIIAEWLMFALVAVANLA